VTNEGRREKPHSSKHPCPDCSFCQWCSDDRCSLCLRQGCGKKRKLSMAEQIALYDAINSKGGALTDDNKSPRD
jgi:hypothetical protein